MLLLRQVLLLLILLLLATVAEWAPHWSMSLVPTDVASPHVPEISVLQVQNAVPCPVVASPASMTGCATWCLLMESWRAPPVKTLASVVGEVMKERRRREREVDNLSTCGCVIQLYLWENI